MDNQHRAAPRAVIFDVDGVLVASPHERSWQLALQELVAGPWHTLSAASSYAPERFTTHVYQEQVAGKPRLSGAIAALRYFGFPDVDELAPVYAAHKQQMIEQLIEAGPFTQFDNA